MQKYKHQFQDVVFETVGQEITARKVRRPQQGTVTRVAPPGGWETVVQPGLVRCERKETAVCELRADFAAGY